MILILDTDYLTLIQRHTEPNHSRLRVRLDAFPQEDVRTTIVSFEEQMGMAFHNCALQKERSGSRRVSITPRLASFLQQHPGSAV